MVKRTKPWSGDEVSKLRHEPRLSILRPLLLS
ncbi:hypothetical protein V6Z12_A11G265700 [Gossypium hirsutum]